MRNKRLIETLKFDKCESFLALTYEYQDEMLWQLAGGDKRKSKNSLFKVKPVVFYDARKTKEFQSSPLFLEHHPVTWKQGLHHSKAYCMVFEDRAELCLGSANLTLPGLTKNRETIGQFTQPGLLDQFAKFLKEFYPYSGNEGHRDYARFLNSVEKHTKGKADPKVRLLTNGYNSKGLTELRDFWRQFETSPAKSIFVVTPFLDQQKLVLKDFEHEELIRVKATVELVTDFSNEYDFPLNHENGSYISDSYDFKTYAPLKTVDSQSPEWRTICESHKTMIFKKDSKFERKLHSKILVLEGENGILIYIGSANFTSRGWLGVNKELGVVQYLEGVSFVDLKESILTSLSANEVKLNINNLRKEVELSEEDLETLQDFYPYFIQSILLKFNNDKQPVFELSMDGLHHSDYDFFWGETELKIKDSSLVCDAAVANNHLLSSRHITVLHKPTGTKYFIPFKLSDEVLGNIQLMLFKDSDDWLSQFGQKLSAFEWDYTPTLEEENEVTDNVVVDEDLETDRNENFTVKMQSYLNYLASYEKYLRDQILDLTKSDQKFSFSDQDPNDLPTYIKYLLKELKESKHSDVEIFKLGEFAQILRRASEVSDSDSIQNLRKHILDELREFLKLNNWERKTPYQQYLRLINDN